LGKQPCNSNPTQYSLCSSSVSFHLPLKISPSTVCTARGVAKNHFKPLRHFCTAIRAVIESDKTWRKCYIIFHVPSTLTTLNIVFPLAVLRLFKRTPVRLFQRRTEIFPSHRVCGSTLPSICTLPIEEAITATFWHIHFREFKLDHFSLLFNNCGVDLHHA